MPEIPVEKTKRIRPPNPLTANAEAVNALSKFEFDPESKDYSLLLVTNVQRYDVDGMNFVLSLANATKNNQLKFAVMTRLGLYTSVDGKGRKDVVDIAKQPLGVGTEQKQGMIQKARNFLNDHM